MTEKPSSLRVLDLFSGAGGFSEGFRQAGYDVVAGIDNWPPALKTHEINKLGDSHDYDMKQVLGKGGFGRAKQKAQEIERTYGRIDVLIGSPPCTEFSYAKNGGQGDTEQGMLLVRTFLVFAAALKPKFWLMENVPRLKHALVKESDGKSDGTWNVPLHRLGIEERSADWDWFEGNCLMIPEDGVYISSKFGAPQARKRYIAGLFGKYFLQNHEQEGMSLGECIEALESQVEKKNHLITDPNYPHHQIKLQDLRDYNYNSTIHPMYWEHMRHLKTRHIQYGKIPFPDKLNQPARTVMATNNAASREAIVIDTGETTPYQGKNRRRFRQAKVREVACLQGFPLDFQFAGASLNMRYRLVGNAVPCQLSYALALSILDEFEESRFEDDSQRMRFEKTLERRDGNRFRPILHSPPIIGDEAESSQSGVYLTFRAKYNRHTRRKMLSSKLKNISSVVVFENTVWDDNKRYGGFWKSCLSIGIGKGFHQIYIDDVSIRQILKSIEENKELLRGDGSKTTAHYKNSPNAGERLEGIKLALSKALLQMERGLPLVCEEWDSFPGYDSDDIQAYLQMIGRKVRAIPSASTLQELFTTDIRNTKGVLGPLDFFDGIDALMLKTIASRANRWMLDKMIYISNFGDAGDALYIKGISDQAQRVYSGRIPLVTLFAAVVSLGIVYHMHIQNQQRSTSFKSIKSAMKKLEKWCGI